MKAKKPQRGKGRAGMLVLAGIALVGAGMIFGGPVRQEQLQAGADAALRRPTGQAQLVSIQPLPEMDGEMCEWVPASATTSLAFALQGPEATGAQRAAEQPYPSAAAKAAGAQRKPVRMIRDPNPAFSAVALDLAHDEVVLQDENTYGILVYNRLENTPPTARMSEPKRMIRGEQVLLEYNCGLYVDPVTGDIYSVNNDTLNLLTIFSHGAKGNVPPVRKLKGPQSIPGFIFPQFYGIAVDEEQQEMLLTAQNVDAVFTYKKTAKDYDAPVRFIQGSQTQLADPHGMALDSKAGLIFVTNWGSRHENEPPDPSNIPWGDGAAWAAGWATPGNRSIPGSGTTQPPSITVYPKDAKGDVAPLRVIQGRKTQMNWPTAIAIDPEHREMFVANDTGHSITVYDINASGDVAPIRVIKGPKTRIMNPAGVAYDAKHEELWVANFGNHAATVYQRTANGDTPPIRMIRNAPLNTPAPMMGNTHTVAYDSKRDEILVTN